MLNDLSKGSRCMSRLSNTTTGLPLTDDKAEERGMKEVGGLTWRRRGMGNTTGAGG